MTHRNMTCAAVDEQLGDYLEGVLDVSAAAEIELHLSGCTACRALVHDFEALARSAATLPEVTPSHDLWPAIAQRIDAPVADLGAYTSARRSIATHSSWRRWRGGAVAAGLVGITALTTYLLTDRAASPVVAQGAGADSSAAAAVAPGASPASSAIAQAPGLPVRDAEGVVPGRITSFSANPGNGAPPVAARETYTSEISVLRGIVSERRDDLDPRTIAILESSISTIDSAIAEARRALDVDPGSRFLSSQLNKALEKKLGLLRTAALLSSRT
ncbi:MAG: zf-HC2 domain-containing protein [Gemmatimonadetes bacterium]|nr:zf-HC2 domain-containing protein [Gemmatimonadota bacterium]